jgi:hypothetical protein
MGLRSAKSSRLGRRRTIRAGEVGHRAHDMEPCDHLPLSLGAMPLPLDGQTGAAPTPNHPTELWIAVTVW